MGLLEIAIAIVSISAITYISGYTYGKRRKRYDLNIGESAVRRLLTEKLPAHKYHLLNNVTLPTRDGSTQIDHVLVSTRGVFVIETKHYSGWLFGDTKSRKWTRIKYRWKSQFQNPIHQNYGHLKAVQTLLDFLNPDVVMSMVVFTGDAEFKSEVPEGVYYFHELPIAIRAHTNEVMSENRMQFCVGRLECARYQLSEETDIEHIQRIEERIGKAT